MFLCSVSLSLSHTHTYTVITPRLITIEDSESPLLVREGSRAEIVCKITPPPDPVVSQ